MNQETVYIVDDDPAIGDAVSTLLRPLGVETEVFRSAEDFLERARPGRQACAVVDLQMPGIDGLELQERLERRGDRMPMVFLSGHGSVTHASRAMRRGAVDFLEKPVDESVLIARIREGLNRRGETQPDREAQARVESLTESERNILDLVISGLSTKQIAANIHRSEHTVEFHRRNIMKKMGVSNVAEMVRVALRAR